MDDGNRLYHIPSQVTSTRPTDLCLKVGELRFDVNREILEKNSEYFRLLLLNVPQVVGIQEVVLPEVDVELLQKCIKFIYGQEIEMHLTTVATLFDLANFLEIKDLCHMITERLGKNLTTQTGTFAVAQAITAKHKLEHLNYLCGCYVLNHFEALLDSQDFVNIDFQHIIMSLQFHRHKIQSWQMVYDAIISWTYTDLGNRIDRFEELFSHIQLLAIPLEYRARSIKGEPLVRSSDSSLESLNLSINESYYRRSRGLIGETYSGKPAAFMPQTACEGLVPQRVGMNMLNIRQRQCTEAESSSDIKRRRLDDTDIRPTDLCLKVGDQRFEVNREILERNSGYFRLALLYVPEVDGIQEVVLPKFDAGMLQKCIKFMYGQEIKIELTTVAALYDFANSLEIKDLCHVITEHLGKNLTTTNGTFAVARVIAVKYKLEHLNNLCGCYVLDHFEELAASEDFVNTDFQHIITSLQFPRHKIHSWWMVYKAIIRWTYADLGNRSDCFQQLFSHIQLHAIPLEHRAATITREPLVRSSDSSLESVYSSINESYRHSEGYVLISQHSSVIRANHPMDARCYNMLNNSPGMLSNYHKIVSMDDYVYVIQHNKKVYRFKPSGSIIQWEQMASMNNHHNSVLPTVAVNGHLYVVGGGLFWSDSSGEMFDATENQWTQIPELTMRADCYSIAETNGEIYVIGGWDGKLPLSAVVKFNLEHKTWSSVAPLWRPRRSSTAAALDCNIFVIGGYEGDLCDKDSRIHSVECFYPCTNVWTTILTYRFGPWQELGACVVDGRIFVAGLAQNKNNTHEINTRTLEQCRTGCSTSTSGTREINICTLEQCSTGWKFAARKVTKVCGRFCLTSCRPRQDFDVVIEVGALKIPAHKRVLAEKSGFFNGMFSHDMMENRNGVAHLHDLIPLFVKLCIDYMYGIALPRIQYNDDKSWSNAEMLHVATTLLIHDVIEHVSEFLKRRLDIRTFAATKHLANLYGCEDLEDACDEFASTHLKSILEIGMLLRFEKEYMMFLVQSTDACQVTCFEAILNWTEHDLTTRRQHFNELFSCVDLIKAPEEYVNSTIKSNNLVMESDECREMVERSFILRNELHQVIFCIDWSLEPGRMPTLSVYSAATGRWKTQQASDADSFFCAYLTFLDDRIYALMSNNHIAQLQVDDPKSTWTNIADVDDSDVDCGELVDMVACSGSLYVFGTDGIAAYDIEEEAWLDMEHCLDKIDYTVVVAEDIHRDCIYVVGGDGMHPRSRTTAECYSITADEWHDIPRTNVPRTGAAGAELNGMIYVLGGVDEMPINSVEFYNPNTSIWTLFTPMQFPRANFTACVIDGSIYAVGGDENSPETMEHICVDDKEWTIKVLPNLREPGFIAGRIKYGLLF